MEKYTRCFADLRFVVAAEVAEFHVDYFIYDIAGFTEDNLPLLQKKDATFYPDPVESMEDAEVFLHGFVKWDGCSNWHFDEQDRLMIHGCGRADIQRIGDIMAACWDWTAEILPNWDT